MTCALTVPVLVLCVAALAAIPRSNSYATYECGLERRNQSLVWKAQSRNASCGSAYRIAYRNVYSVRITNRTSFWSAVALGNQSM